jgi:hypothetical protein
MRVRMGIAALMAMVMVLAAWPAVSAAADRPAYRKYVACAKVVEAPPSRECKVSDEKGAFFRSNLRTVYYKVCVVFPTGKSLCATRQRAKKGELYVNEITSRMIGLHRVDWFVKGKKVGTYRFRISRDSGSSKSGKSKKAKKRR